MHLPVIKFHVIIFTIFFSFVHCRDVLIVTTLDTFTSLIAGCTIFGILGNLAHELGNADISKVVRGGTGLAFISYPEALSQFNFVPQLFAVLFFIMMFVLGVGSAVALCGAIFCILCDHFPNVKHWQLVFVVSVFGFLVSLVYVTPVSIEIIKFNDKGYRIFLLFYLPFFPLSLLLSYIQIFSSSKF